MRGLSRMSTCEKKTLTPALSPNLFATILQRKTTQSPQTNRGRGGKVALSTYSYQKRERDFLRFAARPQCLCAANVKFFVSVRRFRQSERCPPTERRTDVGERLRRLAPDKEAKPAASNASLKLVLRNSVDRGQKSGTPLRCSTSEICPVRDRTAM